MVLTNPDGRTDAHIPKCHCDNYVSLTASRLDKKGDQVLVKSTLFFIFKKGVYLSPYVNP